MGLQNNYDDRSELEDEITELEKASLSVTKPQLPSVQLDEISYNAPTDKELSAAAESSLKDYKIQGESAIRSNSEAEVRALEQKKKDAQSGRKSELNELDDSYRAASENIDNDVVKRGLARSSIAVNAKGALESEYLNRAADIREQYGKKISDIDSDIADVSNKLARALNDFNISYAAKLTEKLNELKTERDKTRTEAIKFNNEVRVKQAKLDEDRLTTESKLYSEALDQAKKESSLDSLSDAQRDALYKKVYAKMDSYLSSLSKEQARLEVRNHTFYRDHLSNYYYYMLYDKYGR